MDRRGNGHSSIISNQGDERESCRTAASWELRKEPCRSRGSRDVVFTTLHLLPRSEGEQCRPTASSLPRLLTGHQAHSRVLDEVRMVSVTVCGYPKEQIQMIQLVASMFHVCLQKTTHIWVCTHLILFIFLYLICLFKSLLLLLDS